MADKETPRYMTFKKVIKDQIRKKISFISSYANKNKL